MWVDLWWVLRIDLCSVHLISSMVYCLNRSMMGVYEWSAQLLRERKMEFLFLIWVILGYLVRLCLVVKLCIKIEILTATITFTIISAFIIYFFYFKINISVFFMLWPYIIYRWIFKAGFNFWSCLPLLETTTKQYNMD